MAKMTRGNLKSLVKECLFEILLEASEENTHSLAESSAPGKRKKSSKRKAGKSTSRRPALDMISMNSQKSAPPQREIDVSGLTSDPVMAAIFKDTAATTLVEQSQAESRPGHATPGRMDAAATAVAQNEPNELFGAASKNWAALAFDE